MELELKNIAKIKNAKVEINGITVIAGENDTGKSTISKVLFSIFNSLFEIDKKINIERKDEIGTSLFIIYSEVGFPPNEIVINGIADQILKNRELYVEDTYKLKEMILSFVEKLEKDELNFSEIETPIKKIQDILKIPDREIMKAMLNRNLNVEFDGQINSINSEESGTIELKIKKKNLEIIINSDKVVNIEGIFKFYTDIIYIDDPFILDGLNLNYRLFNERVYRGHKKYLKAKLVTKNEKVISEILIEEKLKNFYKKLSEIIQGDIVINSKNQIIYRKNNSKEEIKISNLSAGLKSFAILKILFQNNLLEENGTIILDEPEIHLHPEWQLIFAEIIVLLQKEFGMHILLTTHSPYFLEAIEVFSKKYKIESKCKYYLAENENKFANINDVTDDTEKIYKKLAKPFQKLEDINYE